MGCIESICKLGNTSYSTSQPRNRQKRGSSKYCDNRHNFGYYTYGGGDGVGKYLFIIIIHNSILRFLDLHTYIINIIL